jgi:hypothetical protein
MRCTSYMRLISWIRPCGSETVTYCITKVLEIHGTTKQYRCSHALCTVSCCVRYWLSLSLMTNSKSKDADRTRF